MSIRLYPYMEGEGGGSPGGAAAPSPAPAPAPAPSSELSFADIEGVLKFDPFDPAAAKPDGEAPPPVPGTTEPPVGKQPEPAPAPAAPPPDPNAQKLSAMEQQLKDAMARIEQLTKPPAQPGEPAQPAADEIPPYEFQLPAPLMQALDSEDPVQRQQAIGHIMAGTARAVHRTVMAQVAQQIQELVQSFPQIVSSHVTQAQQARTVFDDFYGSYKDLNNPVLRPTVVAVAQLVLKEKNATEWNQEVKEEVARRVYQALGRTMPGALPPAAPPPPPPAMMGGGTRPDGASQQNDIMNTLF